MTHILAAVTLNCHHLPGKIRDAIFYYLSNFSLRVRSGVIISRWQRLEKEVIIRSTASLNLFALVINMLAKSAGRKQSVPLQICSRAQRKERLQISSTFPLEALKLKHGKICL